MSLSAEFSVEGSSAVQAHSVAYSATVDLVALSTEFNTIAWSIVSGSKVGAVTPTITLGGSPTGATASFPQVADPADGLGQAWVVKCLQTDSGGATAVAYRIVGTPNDNGHIPICAGEENYRDLTYGWSQEINALLAVAGGAGTLSNPVDPDDDGKVGIASGGDLTYVAGTAGQVLTWVGAAATWAAPSLGAYGFPYTYDTTTAQADPTAGIFRANHATLSSATALYVDNLEFGGVDVSVWLDALDNYSGPVKGIVRLQSRSDPTLWIDYTLSAVTSFGGYRSLTVAYAGFGPGGLVTTAGDTFLSFIFVGGGNFGGDPVITTTTITGNELRALQTSDDTDPAVITGRKADATGDAPPVGSAVVYWQAETSTGSSTYVERGGIKDVWDYADPEQTANPILWKEVHAWDDVGVALVSRTGRLQFPVNANVPVQVMSFPIADGEQLEFDVDVVASIDGAGRISHRVKRTWSATFVNDGGGVGDTVQWGTDVDKFALTATGDLATGHTVSATLEPTDDYVQLFIEISLDGEPDVAVPSTAHITVTVNRLDLGT